MKPFVILFIIGLFASQEQIAHETSTQRNNKSRSPVEENRKTVDRKNAIREESVKDLTKEKRSSSWLMSLTHDTPFQLVVIRP